MKNSLTFFAAPRRVHRKRKPPTQLLANVVSVTLIDQTGALWRFDQPVNVTENQPCPQLRIQTTSGWHGADSIGAGDDAYTVACDYGSNDLAPGQNWQIVATPVNLSFGNATVALPQSGTTVE